MDIGTVPFQSLIEKQLIHPPAVLLVRGIRCHVMRDGWFDYKDGRHPTLASVLSSASTSADDIRLSDVKVDGRDLEHIWQEYEALLLGRQAASSSINPSSTNASPASPLAPKRRGAALTVEPAAASRSSTPKKHAAGGASASSASSSSLSMPLAVPPSKASAASSRHSDSSSFSSPRAPVVARRTAQVHVATPLESSSESAATFYGLQDGGYPPPQVTVFHAGSPFCNDLLASLHKLPRRNGWSLNLVDVRDNTFDYMLARNEYGARSVPHVVIQLYTATGDRKTVSPELDLLPLLLY